MDTRPRIKLQLSLADNVIEALGWAALLALWGLVIYGFSSLPDKIPIHFNAAGEVDGHGSKSSFILLPLLGTVLFAAITILNKYPHVFNYPKKVTPENAPAQYLLATRLMRYLKLALMVIFTGIVFMTITAATSNAAGIGVWFLPAALGLIFIPLVYFLVKMYRA